MSLLIKCRDCREGVITEVSRGAYKKYCDECLVKRKRISSVKKNVSQRAKRIYPKLLINLTKNYIIMMEGIKA